MDDHSAMREVIKSGVVLVGDSLVLVGLILLPDESCSIRVLLNMAVQTVVCAATGDQHTTTTTTTTIKCAHQRRSAVRQGTS